MPGLMNNSKVRSTLSQLQSNEDVLVAFLLDKTGALVGWSGSGATFSPTGQFPPKPEDEEGEGENLYLSIVAHDYYLGVIFDEKVSHLSIQKVIEEFEPVLEESLQ